MPESEAKYYRGSFARLLEEGIIFAELGGKGVDVARLPRRDVNAEKLEKKWVKCGRSAKELKCL